MRRFSALFKETAELAALSAQADSLTVSQIIWNTIVPEMLRQYTQAGNVKHKRLTVYADNGTVAAKIKLLLPSLLIKLQKQGLEVTSIRVEVQVQSHPAKPAKAQRRLSPAASSQLQQSAEKLAAAEPDSKLSVALTRLSTRL